MKTGYDILRALSDGQGNVIECSIVFYDLLDKNYMPVHTFHENPIVDTGALHPHLILLGAADLQKPIFVSRKGSGGKMYADLHMDENDWHSSGIESIELKDDVLLLRGYVSPPSQYRY